MLQSSPWGRPQDQREVAPGITWVSTASHGGFHLDRCRQSALLKLFPGFQTFAGGPWYEEDQDWAVVVLAFPELDDDFGRQLYNAERTVKGSASYDREQGRPSKWQAVADWLDHSASAGYVRVVSVIGSWLVSHFDDWETGSMGSTPKGQPGWWVSLSKIGNPKERLSVIMPGYPEKPIYTTEEVSQFQRA